MRDLNEGDSVAAMELEHYPGMTEKALEKIAAEAGRRWPGIDVAIDSRHGDPAPRFVIVDDSVALATLSDGAAARAETVNVFQRAPELAQSYAQSFWRLYRQAGGL